MKHYFHHLTSHKKMLAVFGVLICISVWAVVSQRHWGLQADYYTNANWRGEPQIVRIERQPYLKGNTRENILSASVFSVKWTGWIAIQQAGTYRFATSSDDGSRLFLNDTLLVDNGGAHGLQRRSQEIDLEAGMYPLEIRYFQVGGYSTLRVFWTPPGEEESFMPSTFLFAGKPSAFDVSYRRAIVHLLTLLKIAWGLFLLNALRLLVMRFLSSYSSATVMRGSLACVFVLFLGISCVQSFWKVLPESPLHGVLLNAPAPRLSLKSWFAGDFQQAAEKWFNQYVGFRSFWVRSYNQINFSFFRQMPAVFSGTSVVLGKDNWLYSQEYLRENAGYSVKPPIKKLERSVRDLRRLQDELTRRGIAFLFVLSPSKASVYPENMPESYHIQSNDRTYHLVTPLLDTYGIHYIDAYKIFDEIKPGAPYPLFPKGGIHWNDYGAYLIWRESIVRLNQQLSTPLPLPEYDRVTLAPPQGADADLTALLNIWTPNAVKDSCPYPHFTTPPIPPEEQPGVLMVGDSFVWHLADFFSEQQLCADVDVLFYYHHLIRYPRRDEYDFHKKTADWEKLLLTKDIVLIEINQALLHQGIGFGFVKDALAVLKDPSNKKKPRL